MTELDGVLDAAPATPSMSSDLFAVVDALDASATLRRALTDPNVDESQRQRLAHNLLDAKLSPAAVDVVAQAVSLRWAGGRTLAVALERQAVRAELLAAESGGQLDDTEDALFRFSRLVESSPDLRALLADRRIPLADRQSLVDRLLQGRTNASTRTLARRAVAARERTFDRTAEGYLALAAAQKNRVVATVRVAQPLTAEQTSRLRSALSRQVGRPIAIQEVIDPGVLGGIRVELGSEVIEGTVGGRLEEARRLFE
jgi:F-type H+-transporting ATPase subunit delta